MFGKNKGKSRDEIIAESTEVTEVETEKKEDEVKTGDAKLDIELTKIKGQLEALNEVRKATAERFTRSSEQMGEIRGMITDLSKTISKIEVGATKAIDLVDSVQPEKLMIEVKKEDAKVEATRAQLESVEARMKDMLDELKGMRENMNVYKGLQQVMDLNQEMKDEISEMRKMQVNIERHADRVETMFLEVNKKFVEFDKFNDVVKDMKRSFTKIQSDLDKVKVKVDEKSDKNEFVKLVGRFSDFEKHTENILKLLDERSKHVKEDLFAEFKKIKLILGNKYKVDFDAEEEKLKEQGKLDEKGFLAGVVDKLKGSGEKEEAKEGEEEPKEDRQIVEEHIETEKGTEDEGAPEEAKEGEESTEEAKEEVAEKTEEVKEVQEAPKEEEKPVEKPDEKTPAGDAGETPAEEAPGAEEPVSKEEPKPAEEST